MKCPYCGKTIEGENVKQCPFCFAALDTNKSPKESKKGDKA